MATSTTIVKTIEFYPSEKCRLCMMCVEDPSFRAKVEATSSFKRRGTPIAQVMKGLSMSPASWYNHVKLHHYPMARREPTVHPSERIVEKNLPRVPTEAQIMAKEAIISQTEALKENFEEAWDEIITRGLEQIRSGHMQVNGNLLQKALADKSSYVAKKQDRKLDAAKAMFSFMAQKKELPGGSPSTRAVAENPV